MSERLGIDGGSAEAQALGAEKPARRKRSLRLLTSQWTFWIWACVSFAGAATLMVAHTYALPKPATDDVQLRTAVAATRSPGERGSWRALHVLYTRCRCSQRILSALFARGPLPGVGERVVLIGEPLDYERAARTAGFDVEVLTPEQLVARYGAHAAPLFVVADPEDQLRYVGGYTERKQGLAMRDVAILAALTSGRDAAELPLFGCAVSSSLRRMLDPLGLRVKPDGEP
jgi:hypothetical protein